MKINLTSCLEIEAEDEEVVWKVYKLQSNAFQLSRINRKYFCAIRNDNVNTIFCSITRENN